MKQTTLLGDLVTWVLKLLASVVIVIAATIVAVLAGTKFATRVASTLDELWSGNVPE